MLRVPVFYDVGHIDCLAFALSHDYPVAARVLRAAVSNGQLACVELLVAQGVCRSPYLHADTKCWRRKASSRPAGPFGPAQMQSLEHILDTGRPIHTGTLILAARIGDVDCVRFLHSRGVALWDRAVTEGNYEPHAQWVWVLDWDQEWDEEVREEWDEGRDELPNPTSCVCRTCQPHRLAVNKFIILPTDPQRAPHMWSALWYGWAMGAPLTPAMAEVFRAKRRSTRAVLCCFHVATRLGRGKGHLEQRAAWDAMGRMPVDVVDQILLLADLEIPELLRRPLPKVSGVMQLASDAPGGPPSDPSASAGSPSGSTCASFPAHKVWACSWYAITEEELEGGKLKECSGCRTDTVQMRYCGKECQQAEWRVHKPICKRVQAWLG